MRSGPYSTRISRGSKSRTTAPRPTASRRPCATGASGSTPGGEHRLDLDEVVEDGDNVVVTIHITARGRASGVEVDVRFHARFKALDEKVVYVFDYEDRKSAFEAAGLSS
jgi:hypothetical protein